MTIDEKLEGKELFDFLVKNKELLIQEKKFNTKLSDSFMTAGIAVDREGRIIKSINKVDEGNSIQATVVINTTNWMDSHKDVHIPGLWKKSLSETKLLYLLEEHKMTFKGIITDEIKAFTKKLTWKSLGYDAKGETEALIFEANIPKDRNPDMYREYRLGRVKNHSVGMRYVRLKMAINDENYKEEFAVWNEYLDQIANSQEAEKTGYFFAVTEAKVIEGSAVPIGSNIMTPTLEVKHDTQQPPVGTEEPSHKLDIQQLCKIFKN